MISFCRITFDPHWLSAHHAWYLSCFAICHIDCGGMYFSAFYNSHEPSVIESLHSAQYESSRIIMWISSTSHPAACIGWLVFLHGCMATILGLAMQRALNANAAASWSAREHQLVPCSEHDKENPTSLKYVLVVIPWSCYQIYPTYLNYSSWCTPSQCCFQPQALTTLCGAPMLSS